MGKRQIGRSSLYVSPLAFGGNVFGWTVDDRTAFQLLDAFIDGGFDLIDTANSYSRWVPGNKGGESETAIGKWMKRSGNRSRVMIATKVGSDIGQGHRDVSRQHILTAVEDSLRRLQTDYIDLYQTHWDVETTPVEETLEAYAQLVKEGKVRWIGASNLSPARLSVSLEASRKNGWPRYESFQPHYNLYEREAFEQSLQKICTDEHIGVITYYSLASGFLTGKYRSEADLTKSARGNGAKKYLNEKGFRILGALDEISKEQNASPAGVALAWLLTRPAVVAPIASATNPTQLRELMKGVELKLPEEAVSKLTAASD